MAIITSLLDTDLYKLTMMQAVFHQFSGTTVKYKFKCRTNGVSLVNLIPEIITELDNYCSLKFTPEELTYLRGLRFMKPDFVDFLRHYQPCKEYVTITIKNEELDISIAGPWIETILFEVPLLAIINELYFRQFPKTEHFGMDRLNAKLGLIRSVNDPLFRIAEFGTRRRFSKEWQEVVVKTLSEMKTNFHGTSNVLLAMKYGLVPIGTLAHEWLQAPQALVKITDSQKCALEAWAQEYRGDLGIALTDVLGVDAFLKDFDLYFSKLFDGVRHDSGDPVFWMNKILHHYKTKNIDPTTKIAVFSDNLNVPKAIELYDKFKGQMKMLFAIGTNLTNDVGPDPINIVIKMTGCNDSPVAKISDSGGKQTCEDERYLKFLRHLFNLPEET